MSYKIILFGKDGCSKCSSLKKRIDKILPNFPEMSLEYCNVSTQEGIVEFCKTGELNPNRIPAIIIQKDNVYMKKKVVLEDIRCGDAALPTLLGMQTDYSEKGILTNEAVLQIFNSV